MLLISYYSSMSATAGALFYLDDEHDDCERSLMGGAAQFQHQVYYGHVVALNKFIISLLVSPHFQQLQ